MKRFKDIWKNGATTGTKTSMYDMFVQVHSNSYNSILWHGTSAFLLAHKHFIYKFESCLRYIAAKYYKDIGWSEEEACTLTLPYYSWELDADLDPKDPDNPFWHSSLLDSKSWGSYNPNSVVTDGVFSDPDWICNQNTSLDNTQFTSSKAAGWSNRLKRYFDTSQVPITYGPAQIADAIICNTKYFDIAKFIENGAHSTIHLLFGFVMKTMSSPDEPTFWLHHCNIDRVYHMWADCQGYELCDPSALTSNQYQAANPLSVQKNAPAKLDSTVSPAKNCSVNLDDKIYYYWYPAKTISKVFPDNNWPTYRQMWSMGDEVTGGGFDGLCLRYGEDEICGADGFAKNCPDTVWRWVNQPDPYQKRSVAQRPGKKIVHPLIQSMNDKFHTFKLAGRTNREALRELAMEECNSIPKLQITDDVRMWIEMNGGDVAEYDRICDNADNAITEKKEDKTTEAATSNTAEIENGQMLTPVWVIVVASVASVIGVIIIVVVVVIIVKKRNAAAQANLYVQM